MNEYIELQKELGIPYIKDEVNPVSFAIISATDADKYKIKACIVHDLYPNLESVFTELNVVLCDRAEYDAIIPVIKREGLILEAVNTHCTNTMCKNHNCPVDMETCGYRNRYKADISLFIDKITKA